VSLTRAVHALAAKSMSRHSASRNSRLRVARLVLRRLNLSAKLLMRHGLRSRANFGDDPDRVQVARLKLANAMLSVADEDSRDVEILKRAALQAMAQDYRVRSPRIATLLTGQR
jgi:hypothetical protein